MRVEKQIDEIEEKIDDCFVHEFDLPKIQAVVDHYTHRPVTKAGKTAALGDCENQITEFLRFCKWLGGNADWSCPPLDLIDRRVMKVHTDALRNAKTHNRHWTPDELREVFATAQPLTKLLIAVGLNTGSGAAELGRMRVDHFLFDQPHPCGKRIKCDLVGGWFFGTRSEAFLWPWVVELVKEQIATCKKFGWPYLFTEDGEPLYRHNDLYEELGLPLPNTSKPDSRFVKRYSNALDLAENEGRIFRRLPPKSLRKTLTNYLVMEAHEDLGSLLLSHQTGDSLLEHYADRPYGRLHSAISEAEEYWDLTKQPSNNGSNASAP